MIKVLFVDDEILAMEYLQSLVSWEEHGYQVVGHALNGRKALEIFEKENPQIVISDIKMVGMDGLELTKQLKTRNPDVAVILLSAYKDFEYAQKGIEYGVSNYLLKHELCEEKILEELGKVADKLRNGEKRKKIYHRYFVRQLIYNREDFAADYENELGNRFFMLLLQKNLDFCDGTFNNKSWEEEEIHTITTTAEETGEGIEYLAEERLGESHLILLFKISDINSKYIVTKEIERMSRKIMDSLADFAEDSFNLIYSDEIRKSEISSAFQTMSRLIHYAVFWKAGRMYALNRLPVPEENEKIDWNEKEKELKEIVYKEQGHLEDYIEYLFETVNFPVQDLQALKELIYMLENLLRQIENQENLSLEREKKQSGKVKAIQDYYMNCYSRISENLQEREDKKYSRIVNSMLQYIKRNFDKELNLEILGEEFEMNGVYLGQIFKKETGYTFLKYLTACRMEAAQRLLTEGKYNIAEVSEMVGYRSSQYFSQIFMKNVGTTPQEYRKWSKKQ